MSTSLSTADRISKDQVRQGAEMKAYIKSTPIDMREVLRGTGKLPKLMLMAMRQIRDDRIEQGRTTDGRPMLDGRADRYTPAYEARKRNAGRHPYSKGDRLVWSGAMLGAQHIEASDKVGQLLFSLEEAIKAYGNDRRRAFILFVRKEIDRAFDLALQEIRSQLQS